MTVEDIKYKPSREQVQGLRVKPDMFKVSGDEVFATFQGEGDTTGKAAVFLRLHFCNLKCDWCDTKYTWDKNVPEFWQESKDWNIDKTALEVANAWNEKFPKSYYPKKLVITGGEPMLQQGKIARLLDVLEGWSIEIETNGTIPPLDKLAAICQFNVSPKLENSGNSKNMRFKPDVLKIFAEAPNSWFKFVVVSRTDFNEIDEIISTCQIPADRVIIMPEGLTKEEVALHAQNLLPELEKRGWRVLPRLQLILFGPKRRT